MHFYWVHTSIRLSTWTHRCITIRWHNIHQSTWCSLRRNEHKHISSQMCRQEWYTQHHTGLYINAEHFLIPIRKALHRHISKMTYCSLAVYFHIFIFSFYSLPVVFARRFTKMGKLQSGITEVLVQYLISKEDERWVSVTVLRWKGVLIIPHHSVFVIHLLFGLSAVYCARHRATYCTLNWMLTLGAINYTEVY